MFGIKEARERVFPPNLMKALYVREIEDALHDQHVLLHRQFYTGREFRIGLKAPPRKLIQRYCDEGMFARLHDWEITYKPARPCDQCRGLMELPPDEYNDEWTPCDCTYFNGWLPESWVYKCRRCGKHVYKGGV